MTSGLTRFGGPRAIVCNLGTSGTLAAHTAGAAYSGTFNVTNRVGEVTAELVSATPALPAGWSLQVNQATGVVTLAWPAAAPVSAPPLPNLDFEAGAANWLLGNAWIIDGAGLQDGGTQAGRYRGAGQSSLRHAQAVPVTPGTTITASARISKGTTRADFGGGAVVLEWLTAAGAPLDFSVGNVVNTGTAAFQTSTVTATAPAGAGLVRLAVSATRDIKGRASDSVYVDNVTWNHTYTLPGGVNTDYAVVIRVRDGRGCQATLSQTVAASLVDPLTLSLLHFDGAVNSTDYTDDKGLTWVPRTGNTPATIVSGGRFGNTINLATSNNEIINTSSVWQRGTGDFTIEAFMFAQSFSSVFFRALFGNWAADNGMCLWVKDNRELIFIVNNQAIGTPAGSFAWNTWTHVAFTRQAGFGRLFVDGVLRASGTTSGSLTRDFMILGGNGTTTDFWNGFLDEFRFSSVARYTSNFTPPTAIFPG